MDKSIDTNRVRKMLIPRVEPGFRFVQALVSRQFPLEMAAWYYDPEPDEVRLAVVSSVVDKIGPAAIYKTLFDAFNAAVTPPEINPMIIDVFSPFTATGRDLMKVGIAQSILPLKDRKNFDTIIGISADRMIVCSPGVYVVPTIVPRNEAARRFKEFEKIIQKAA